MVRNGSRSGSDERSGAASPGGSLAGSLALIGRALAAVRVLVTARSS
jgi:hypothetical protein